jgi:hypothetical protein
MISNKSVYAKEVTAKALYEMGKIGSTQQELCDYFGIKIDTLKSKGYWSDYEAGLAEMKSELRREMIRTAMGGDTKMQIWLSKNYLGMSDKVEYEIPNAEITLKFSETEETVKQKEKKDE